MNASVDKAIAQFVPDGSNYISGLVKFENSLFDLENGPHALDLHFHLLI